MCKKVEIPIFVINLKQDKERLLFMQKQFEANGKDFRVIEAIDGNNLSSEQYATYSKERSLACKKRELSNGEIACVLSHIEAWELIIEENFDEALILEDDVFLSKSLFKVLENREKLPADYEFINFRTDVFQFPFGKYIYGNFRASNLYGYANGNVAYLINIKGIKKLLNNVYPIRLPADDLTGRTHITDVISYGIYPEVTFLNKFPSSIWGMEVFDKPNFMSLKRQQLSHIIYLIVRFFGLSWLLLKFSKLVYFSFPKFRRR
jgi:glycosyl transferase, family 25